MACTQEHAGDAFLLSVSDTHQDVCCMRIGHVLAQCSERSDLVLSLTPWQCLREGYFGVTRASLYYLVDPHFIMCPRCRGRPRSGRKAA